MKVTPPEGRVGPVDEWAAFFQNELLRPGFEAMHDKASYGVLLGEGALVRAFKKIERKHVAIGYRIAMSYRELI